MGFLDGLLDLLGSIASQIAAILVELFNLIIQVASFIWSVLVNVANFMLDVFAKVGTFFKHIWESVIKGVLVKVFHAIQAVHRFLETKLRPVIKFLTRVRQYIDRIYRTYVRPFLRLIQHIRQVLSILRLLHIRIAEQLDRVLAQITADINKAFATIRGTLNATIDLLNILADPEKLVRKPTLILSLRRIVHSFIRQVTGLPTGYWFPSPRPTAPRGLGNVGSHFDPTDPQQNPPASFFLGLDSGVPSLEFQDPDVPVPDSLVDGVDPLDFFDGAAYSAGNCIDVEVCLQDAAQSGVRGEFDAIP